jgi:1,4-alpha-glucan branching enzyme
MVEKNQLGGGKVRVTFRIRLTGTVGSLDVCGDFNDWNAGVTPLTKGADGSWSAAITLPAGRVYRFRYRDEHGIWHDDPDADGYEPNGYGGTNSLVDLVSVKRDPPASKAPAKKKTPGRKPGRRST